MIEYSVSLYVDDYDLIHKFSTTSIDKVVMFLDKNGVNPANYFITEYDLNNLDDLGLPEIILQINGEEWLDN